MTCIFIREMYTHNQAIQSILKTIMKHSDIPTKHPAPYFHHVAHNKICVYTHLKRK